MDKVKKYRQFLKEELEHHAAIPFPNAPAIESRVIIKDNDFLLLNIGWSKGRYFHGLIFHFEIKNGKVWLLKNNTDIEIGQRLIEKGIPKSDIVIGFVNELERTLDGYALA
ncbi:MAG: element excision factor XisI family protein [Bacteroidota bacterium]